MAIAMPRKRVLVLGGLLAAAGLTWALWPKGDSDTGGSRGSSPTPAPVVVKVADAVKAADAARCAKVIADVKALGAEIASVETFESGLLGDSDPDFAGRIAANDKAYEAWNKLRKEPAPNYAALKGEVAAHVAELEGTARVIDVGEYEVGTVHRDLTRYETLVATLSKQVAERKAALDAVRKLVDLSAPVTGSLTAKKRAEAEDAAAAVAKAEADAELARLADAAEKAKDKAAHDVAAARLKKVAERAEADAKEAAELLAKFPELEQVVATERRADGKGWNYRATALWQETAAFGAKGEDGSYILIHFALGQNTDFWMTYGKTHPLALGALGSAKSVEVYRALVRLYELDSSRFPDKAARDGMRLFLDIEPEPKGFDYPATVALLTKQVLPARGITPEEIRKNITVAAR